MKVYVAAPWADIIYASCVADVLHAAGFRVVSQWHKLDPVCHRASDRQAISDLNDLWDADALVVLNSRLSEGKAFECGWAIAHHIHVVVVGTRSDANIFHYLPEVTMVPTVAAAIEFFRTVD